MHVIITGGGTGGHIYPALAIARALKKKYENPNILFLGTRNGLEASLIPQEGFPISFISAKGLSSNPARAFRAIFATGLGVMQSFSLIRRFRPVLMIGTGGYVSAPIIFAGSILNVPAVILEQNTIPGKTTRFLAKIARKVCVSFEETKKYLPSKKVCITGNPIREEIVTRTREEGRASLGIPQEKLCILITGASQGARSINEGILHAIPQWRDMDWSILHLTGDKNFNEVNEKARGLLEESKLHYKCLGFLRNIEDAYAACDLVICRAGATTIAEITARGIPAVIIPYPYSAEAHQEKNARWLESNGAGKVILDSEIQENLASIVNELLKDDRRLREMAEKCKSLGKTKALEEIMKVLDEFMSKREV